MPTMLHVTPDDFIASIRNSFTGSVQIYSNGSCYQLYLIVKQVFPSAVPYWSHINSHCIIRIEDTYYDINGVYKKDTATFHPAHHLHSELVKLKFNLWNCGLECPTCDDIITYEKINPDKLPLFSKKQNLIHMDIDNQKALDIYLLQKAEIKAAIDAYTEEYLRSDVAENGDVITLDIPYPDNFDYIEYFEDADDIFSDTPYIRVAFIPFSKQIIAISVLGFTLPAPTEYGTFKTNTQV